MPAIRHFKGESFAAIEAPTTKLDAGCQKGLCPCGTWQVAAPLQLAAIAASLRGPQALCPRIPITDR